MTDRSALIERLTATRARTLALYAPLDDTDVARTPDPIMSPPLWDLGHIAAYQELWVECRLQRRPSRHPDLQRAYDAFETPRARRTQVRLLDRGGCEAYLAQVHEASLEAVSRLDVGVEVAEPQLAAGGFVFDLVAQHEAQHTETVLQTLQMFDDGTYRPAGRRPLPAAADAKPGRLEVAAGTFVMGAPDDRFAYDCERPAHERHVGAFAIDRTLTTNAQYLEFMDAGGYSRAELWSPEGWEWRTREQIGAPRYWRPGRDGWLTRSFDEVSPVDPALPVCHISFWEADAYARWAGGRLPTEAEWERAAAGADAGAANLGQDAFGAAPVGAFAAGASSVGCVQMLGDVWEWTASPFAPYPGFRAFPYPEYSEVFFGGDYRVLRGGSWATQTIASRTSFRNWDHPYRRQIFAGVRVAWDLPE